MENSLFWMIFCDTTGRELADSLLEFLDKSSLDRTYFVHQGYDSARAMSRQLHGIQGYFTEQQLLALYSYCATHSFNLVISSACDFIYNPKFFRNFSVRVISLAPRRKDRTVWKKLYRIVQI